MWIDDAPKSAGADAFGLLHPDDNGYAMMSANLYRALAKAYHLGRLH